MRRYSLRSDVRRRVSITLPPGLLGYLAPASFLAEENTTTNSDSLPE
jgi:hypothetical protein